MNSNEKTRHMYQSIYGRSVYEQLRTHPSPNPDLSSVNCYWVRGGVAAQFLQHRRWSQSGMRLPLHRVRGSCIEHTTSYFTSTCWSNLACLLTNTSSASGVVKNLWRPRKLQTYFRRIEHESLSFWNAHQNSNEEINRFHGSKLGLVRTLTNSWSTCVFPPVLFWKLPICFTPCFSCNFTKSLNCMP